MNFRTQLLATLSLHFQNKNIFTLQEVYQVAEGAMSYHYPNTSTIRSSIRHNMQKLEKEGHIFFIDENGHVIKRKDGNGLYSWAY